MSSVLQRLVISNSNFEQHMRPVISENPFQQLLDEHSEFKLIRNVFSEKCGEGAGFDKRFERFGSFGAHPSNPFESTGGFGASPSSISEHQAAPDQVRAALLRAFVAPQRALKAFPEAPAAPGKRIRTIRTLWGHRASRNCDFERPYGVFEAKTELGPPSAPIPPRPRVEI